MNFSQRAELDRTKLSLVIPAKQTGGQVSIVFCDLFVIYDLRFVIY
jgi:hypothetical protein